MVVEKKKILICCDTKEEFLANELKKVIAHYFDSEVETCVFSSQLLEKPIDARMSFFNNALFVFILCSPYSIGQPEINFISGVAVRHALETENYTRIVPICHSGQQDKDLPEYLKAQQKLELGSGDLFDDFLENIKHLSKHSGAPLDEMVKKDLISALEKMPEIGVSSCTKDIKEKFSVEKSKFHNLLMGEKNGGSSSSLLEKIRINKNIKIFAGIQYCLLVENDIYVGLKITADSNTGFCSSIKTKGIFELGHLNEIDSIDCIFDLGSKGRHVTQGSVVHSIMQTRTLANGINLYHIDGSENGVSTVFVNDNGDVTQLEIGVWKYLELSDSFPVDENSYWIWVKDGAIGYWSYPSEASIPRFIDPEPRPEHDSFIPTEDLNKRYGRPEMFTPFASDDVLKVDNVIKEPFSVISRKLLTIF